jgi:hypothetical protein
VLIGGWRQRYGQNDVVDLIIDFPFKVAKCSAFRSLNKDRYTDRARFPARKAGLQQERSILHQGMCFDSRKQRTAYKIKRNAIYQQYSSNLPTDTLARMSHLCPSTSQDRLTSEHCLELVIRDYLVRKIRKIAKTGPGRPAISKLDAVIFDRAWFDREAAQLKEKFAKLVSVDFAVAQGFLIPILRYILQLPPGYMNGDDFRRVVEVAYDQIEGSEPCLSAEEFHRELRASYTGDQAPNVSTSETSIPSGMLKTTSLTSGDVDEFDPAMHPADPSRRAMSLVSGFVANDSFAQGDLDRASHHQEVDECTESGDGQSSAH